MISLFHYEFKIGFQARGYDNGVGDWENANIADGLCEVKRLHQMLLKVVNADRKGQENKTRRTRREDVTLNESNNDSASSNDSSITFEAEPSNQIAPIYSNFPITEFYSIGHQGDLPKELYKLLKHILDLNIEVSPVNAYYKGTTIPNIQQQVALRKTFGAQFGEFSHSEDKQVLSTLRDHITSKVVSSALSLFNALRQVQVETSLDERFTLNIVGLYFGRRLPERIGAQVCDRLVCLIFRNLTGKMETTSKNLPKYLGPPSNLPEDSSFINSTLCHSQPKKGSPLLDFPADLSSIQGPQDLSLTRQPSKTETFADFPKDQSSIPHAARVTLNSSEESVDESSHFLLTTTTDNFLTPPTSKESSIEKSRISDPQTFDQQVSQRMATFSMLEVDKEYLLEFLDSEETSCQRRFTFLGNCSSQSEPDSVCFEEGVECGSLGREYFEAFSSVLGGTLDDTSVTRVRPNLGINGIVSPVSQPFPRLPAVEVPRQATSVKMVDVILQVDHAIPAPSVEDMTNQLISLWGDSVEQVVLRKTGLNSRALSGENKVHVHGQLVGLALRVSVLHNSNRCLDFLNKWPAKFLGRKVIGCRKVEKDVDTENTLVDQTANHRDLMTTVLSKPKEDTIKGQDGCREEEEEEDPEDSSNGGNPTKNPFAKECDVQLQKLKYNDYVNQAENSQMKLQPHVRTVRTVRLKKVLVDDDLTPKMKEKARVATVEGEVKTKKPSLKKAFVALEKIDLGREVDPKELNNSNGVDGNTQLEIRSPKVQVKFINDADSPEIVEKTIFKKSKLGNTEKSPQELERSVEEVETPDEAGLEEDVDNELFDEEDWEKLEEEADAAMSYVMSWLSESSVEPEPSPAFAGEEVQEETEELTGSEAGELPDKGATEEVENSNCDAKKETEEENTEHEETSGNAEGTNESSGHKICVNIVLDDNVSEMKDLERCPSSVERIPLYHDPTLPQGWSRKVVEFFSKDNNTHV